ncbi:hypothetical protein DFS28_1242 [Pseudomonas sp. 478]|nr:hypothetical protein DFS28_1242 [Pseudomonas sp. 478]TCV36636.1 hypothetical protein EDB99_1422 [Pseudomonas sp. 460]
MKKQELSSNLHAIGVSSNSYSLGEIRHSDCVCVVLESGKWKVYYVERDIPAELAVLDTEEQAYDFVFETFCKWLGLRRPH